MHKIEGYKGRAGLRVQVISQASEAFVSRGSDFFRGKVLWESAWSPCGIPDPNGSHSRA